MKSRRYIYLLVILSLIVSAFLVQMTGGNKSVVIEATETPENRINSNEWVDMPVRIEVEEDKPVAEKEPKQRQKKVKEARKTPKQENIPDKEKPAENSGPGKGKSGTADEGFNLLAQYMMPVDFYLWIMTTSKGAKAIIYDTDSGNVISKVDVLSGELTGDTDTSNMSIRGRRITEDYPKSRQAIEMAERLYGPGLYEIILLLPRRLDEYIYAEVKKAIIEQGIDVKKVTSVTLQFRDGGVSKLDVRIDSISGTFGTARIGREFKI